MCLKQNSNLTLAIYRFSLGDLTFGYIDLKFSEDVYKRRYIYYDKVGGAVRCCFFTISHKMAFAVYFYIVYIKL